METKTIEYVEADVLFAKCEKAWWAFCNADPDCSWGDNSYTLITSTMIVEVLEDFADDEEMDEEDRLEIKTVLKRIQDTGKEFYVNLEG